MLAAEQLRVVEAAIAAHRGTEGAALPILHHIQSALGFVPQAVLPVVAEALNRSRAELHGVASFYHDFRDAPAGRHLVQLCQAEACQAMGVRQVTRESEQRLGLALGETSPDGALTLEAVYCLGLCACAPAALVDGAPLGRVDAAALAAAVGR